MTILQPLVVSGCQRSGTTLMSLILGSHPQVNTIDEVFFRRHFTLDKMRQALAEQKEGRNCCFKIPMQSHQLAEIQAGSSPPARLIWMLRDPRAVVASMVDLHLPVSRFVSVSWACSYIHKEIINVLQFLPQHLLDPLEAWIHRFRLIENVPGPLRPAPDVYFTAALCWYLKQLTLKMYLEQGLAIHLVRYEKLVSEPEPVLRALLAQLELDWEPSVLAHHRAGTGHVIGGTRRDTPISSENLDKWKRSLSPEGLAEVREVCTAMASEFAYSLD